MLPSLVHFILFLTIFHMPWLGYNDPPKPVQLDLTYTNSNQLNFEPELKKLGLIGFGSKSLGLDQIWFGAGQGSQGLQLGSGWHLKPNPSWPNLTDFHLSSLWVESDPWHTSMSDGIHAISFQQNPTPQSSHRTNIYPNQNMVIS